MSPEEAGSVLLGARVDPVRWARDAFGFRPWKKQREVIESVRDHRVTAVRSCHAIGKSTLAAFIVIWFLLTHPRSIVITTATTKRQVKGILWREVHAFLRRAKVPIGGHLTETQLKLDDDWWAWGFTSKDYDATQFQGFHAPAVLVVVDEAAGVSPTVFEGLDSAMSSGHARMLLIGNPTDGSGDFGRAFMRNDYARFNVSAFDTPNFTKYGVTLEDIRRGDGLKSGPWMEKVTGPLPYPQLISPTWVRDKWISWCGGREEGETDPRWQARILGHFPEGGDDALIPLRWVEEANERWQDFADRDRVWTPEVFIGCDVARYGDDATTRAFYHPGCGVRAVVDAPKQDTMQTAGMLLVDEASAGDAGFNVTSIRIDADGLGAGVFDRVAEQRGDLAVEMRGGMRADDSEHYANRRAEWFWRLRELLDPAGEEPIALPPDDELTRQLVSMKWKLKSDGKIAIESKDEIKARIGRSPDKADAVAYAVAAGVVSSSEAVHVDTNLLHSPTEPW